MQAQLSRSNIQQFLDLVGARSLDEYLGAHGSTLAIGLETRLAWAQSIGRSSPEAVFLLDHARSLRQVLAEGPGWQERLAEEEQRVRAEEVARHPVLTSPPVPRRTGPERIEEGRTIAPEGEGDGGYLTLMEFLTAPPPPTRHDVALKLGEKETPIRAPAAPNRGLPVEPRPPGAVFTAPDGRTIEPPPARHAAPAGRSTSVPLLAGLLGAVALVVVWLVLR